MPYSSTASSGGIKQIIRGTVDATNAVTNATIGSVNTAKCFVVSNNTGSLWSWNYFYTVAHRVRLTSATNLEFQSGSATGTYYNAAMCAYEVVEFA